MKNSELRTALAATAAFIFTAALGAVAGFVAAATTAAVVRGVLNLVR